MWGPIYSVGFVRLVDYLYSVGSTNGECGPLRRNGELIERSLMPPFPLELRLVDPRR